MPLLSEEEKQEIALSLVEPGEEILSESATILRQTLTSDGRGGQTASYASGGADDEGVPCMISRDTPKTDQVEGGKPVVPQLWRVTFLYTVSLTPTDRIQIGTRVFEIVGDVGLGTYSIVNRALCRETM